MVRVFRVLIACLIIPISCSDKTSDPSGSYNVVGSVYYNDLPIANATVSIDNMLNWTTQTNSQGNFEISGVSNGIHSLKASYYLEDNSFSERTMDIAVYDNVELNTVVLPKAVELFPPDSVTYNSISMKWSQSTADDFREYKVYRHHTSGLDETTGELVHVSTFRSDTLFTDTGLSSLFTYYYRVYIMNEYGRLGGSNIVSATTENYEVIQNGSFEIIDQSVNFPESWRNGGDQDFITIDSLETQDGRYSVGVAMDRWDSGHSTFTQLIDPDLLIHEARYRITYWVKADSLDDQAGFFAFIQADNWQWHLLINPIIGSHPGFDWREFSYEFTVPDGLETSNYTFGFSLESPAISFTAWFDNVSIQRIE